MNGDEEAPRPDWDGHLVDENGTPIDEYGEPLEPETDHSEIGAKA